MNGQYSFSRSGIPPLTHRVSAALALDSGSPLVSVAVAIEGSVAAVRSTEARHSSSRLLRLIDTCLAQAGARIGDVELLVGLQGPGSFTGLRVGLATLQGLRLALGVPAATLSTFQALASLAAPGEGAALAAVDALRGDWLVQQFTPEMPPKHLCEPTKRTTEEMASAPPVQIIGFGTQQLRPLLAGDVRIIEPGPLAPQALELLSWPELYDWRQENLSHPLYLSPPVASPPPELAS